MEMWLWTYTILRYSSDMCILILWTNYTMENHCISIMIMWYDKNHDEFNHFSVYSLWMNILEKRYLVTGWEVLKPSSQLKPCLKNSLSALHLTLSISAHFQIKFNFILKCFLVERIHCLVKVSNELASCSVRFIYL